MLQDFPKPAVPPSPRLAGKRSTPDEESLARPLRRRTDNGLPAFGACLTSAPPPGVLSAPAVAATSPIFLDGGRTDSDHEAIVEIINSGNPSSSSTSSPVDIIDADGWEPTFRRDALRTPIPVTPAGIALLSGTQVTVPSWPSLPAALSAVPMPVTPQGTVLHVANDDIPEVVEDSVPASGQRRADGEDAGDDFAEQEEEEEDYDCEEYEGDSDEEEEEGEADGEDVEEAEAVPELARLFARVAELRQRVLEIGGSELTPHLIRLRTLLEQGLQARDLLQGLSSEAIDANTLTMTLAVKPSPLSPGDVGDATDAAQRQCMICLEEFQMGDRLRVLPCFHRYHCACVDNWFSRSRQCPVCKHDVTADDSEAILGPHSRGLQRADSAAAEPDIIEVITDDELLPS